MATQLFVIYDTDGCSLQDSESFRLHDFASAFERNPRVFTTFVAASRGESFRIIGLERHISRLLRDAGEFHLPRFLDANDIERGLFSALRSFHENFPTITDIRIRLVAGNNALEIFLDQFVRRHPYNASVSVVAFTGERKFSAQKTTLTTTSLAAHDAALKKHSDDAILVTPGGLVTEGAWSNIFWCTATGDLYTTEHQILHGVTRSLIMDRFDTRRAVVHLDDLKRLASEIFLTQSTDGIIPVSSIDAHPVGDGSIGPQTLKIMDWYEHL